MIQELATIFVIPEQCKEFENVFPEAIECIKACKGYLRHELHRGVENPYAYHLSIHWETLEDHTIGFRNSENFVKWRGYIQKFFSQAPEVKHVRLITSSEQERVTPKPVTLVGKHITLRPLVVDQDAALLFERSNGSAFSLNSKTCESYDAQARIWNYLFDSKPETVEDMKRLLQRRVDTARALCFCIVDSQSQTPIGVCNYMNNYPEHSKIELGGIWLSPIAQGTGACAEMAELLIQNAFEQGYHRIEWKCDAKNEKSRHVAEKLGFKFEGIQESHMRVKGNLRDTAWFRILKAEK